MIVLNRQLEVTTFNHTVKADKKWKLKLKIYMADIWANTDVDVCTNYWFTRSVEDVWRDGWLHMIVAWPSRLFVECRVLIEDDT